MKSVVEVDVGRAGLGNCLLPWARALLFAESHGLPMLYPNWNHLRMGPWLRGERDKRRYSVLFQSGDYISGLRRIWLKNSLPALTEASVMQSHMVVPESARFRIVFSGLGDFFNSLQGHHEFLRQRLWSMTRPGYRRASQILPAPFFAAHVRRGDQVLPNQSESKVRDHVQCTSLEWYIKTIRKLRRERRFSNIPFIIFSDGSAEQMAPLLREDNVYPAPSAPSIVDLLTLSRCTLLLASGYSTFSMWASYLGGMPTLYAPGKIQQRVQVSRDNGLELELANEEYPPKVLIDGLATRIT